MTKVILSAVQSSGNCEEELRSGTRTKNYLAFLTVRKMIYKFLNYDRVIFVPTKIPKFTELELANKLKITPTQLRKLQTSKTSYKQIIGKINTLLIELYCNTKWV